jgi:outer membrane protein OmpU
MSRFLTATAILALSAGIASAEVTLSGDARMGIIGGDGLDTAFTSRARVKFTLSGETDGGLAFGASFRAHQAGGAANGLNGDVFISGAFGKLSMGDVDGAAQSAVGQVSGVGLTGLDDLNEILYLADGDSGLGTDPTALYEYSTGAFTGYISVTNPGAAPGFDAAAVGVKYATDAFTVALGYEQADFFGFGIDHIVVGATATFGAVTAKATYGQADGAFFDNDEQYALSLDYTADALTVTAFGSKYLNDGQSFGLGASYDLGGGAKVVAGYSDDDGASLYDMGLSFDF